MLLCAVVGMCCFTSRDVLQHGPCMGRHRLQVEHLPDDESSKNTRSAWLARTFLLIKNLTPPINVTSISP